MRSHDRERTRQNRRLRRLRDRIAVASVLGFATVFGLAGHHSTGTSKHVATRLLRRAASASSIQTRFFDEQDDGYAFADQPPARTVQPAGPPPAQPLPPGPPAARTSVS